jgi:hypothetical protein
VIGNIYLTGTLDAMGKEQEAQEDEEDEEWTPTSSTCV